MKVTLSYSFVVKILIAATFLPIAARVQAQDDVPPPPDETGPQARVQFKLYTFDGKDELVGAVAHSPRLQMMGMQYGFLVNPLGLDDDDPPGLTDTSVRTNPNDPDVVQLNIGTHNPYLELRLPGDPGGLGYYKVHSQVQLIEAGKTSFCLNLQAYTPAGVENGGIANGPTTLVPTVACFQDLGYGAALHTYVGQNIQASSGWTDRINNSFQYGMAVQCAVPGTGATADQGLFVFLEALGRYSNAPISASSSNASSNAPYTRTALWEFVPGVQMRLSDNCWMNVAVSRYNFLSASWKY
jgi:hypothetical protein